MNRPIAHVRMHVYLHLCACICPCPSICLYTRLYTNRKSAHTRVYTDGGRSVIEGHGALKENFGVERFEPAVRKVVGHGSSTFTEPLRVLNELNLRQEPPCDATDGLLESAVGRLVGRMAACR